MTKNARLNSRSVSSCPARSQNPEEIHFLMTILILIFFFFRHKQILELKKCESAIFSHLRKTTKMIYHSVKLLSFSVNQQPINWIIYQKDVSYLTVHQHCGDFKLKLHSHYGDSCILGTKTMFPFWAFVL